MCYRKDYIFYGTLFIIKHQQGLKYEKMDYNKCTILSKGTFSRCSRCKLQSGNRVYC